MSPRNAATTLKGRTYTFRDQTVVSVTTALQAYPKPGLLWWSAKEAALCAIEAMDATTTTKQAKQWLLDDAQAAHEATATHIQRHKKVCDYTPDIVSWLAGASTRKRDTAGERGTAVHGAAEHDTDLADVPENAKKAYESYRAWVRDYQPEILAKEFQVFNEVDQYAGSGDLIARVNGIVYLIDLKTSSSLHHDMRFQLAAYRYAEFCIAGDDIDAEATEALARIERTAILHLTDEGYGFYEVAAGFAEYQEFLNIKRVHEVATFYDRTPVGEIVPPATEAAA